MCTIPVKSVIMFQSFMDTALDQARKAAAMGEVPVGAVIVHGPSQRIIAQTHNLVEQTNDPTGHAEILALRLASKTLGSARLQDCDLYVTLEPCAMCAGAISFARIRRLYYGASDPKGGGVEHGGRFFNQDTCHHRPEVYEGIRGVESTALLRAFFSGLRTD